MPRHLHPPLLAASAAGARPVALARRVCGGCAAWAWARDPDRRSPTPILPPTCPFSRGWWQVSGCRGTARQRRKQDAAEIRLLTCSCEYPGLIKAELPVVSLLPPSASPSPSPLPAAARALTDRQKPVASGSRTTPPPRIPSVQHGIGLMLSQGWPSITCTESPGVLVNKTVPQTLLRTP